jgi:hypothetical protein
MPDRKQGQSLRRLAQSFRFKRKGDSSGFEGTVLPLRRCDGGPRAVAALPAASGREAPVALNWHSAKALIGAICVAANFHWGNDLERGRISFTPASAGFYLGCAPDACFPWELTPF